MKTNPFKYIFIIIIIGLLIFGAIKIFVTKNNQESNENNVAPNVEVSLNETLNLSITELDTLNPILSKNRNVYDISNLIFEPLIKIDENSKVSPCLATEWSSVDGLTYIVKLNKEAKWSDDMPFIAKDVVFTVEKLKESNISSIYKENVSNISSVEEIDDNTIRIFLSKKDPYFEYNLTFPILASHYYYKEDFVKTARNKTPIGTGPYKISSSEANLVVLKKNSNYYKENNAKFTTINIFLYDSIGEAYSAFKARKIDMLNMATSNYEDVIGSIGYSKSEYIGRDLDLLALNCNKEILKSNKVRQAINSAIDKERIITEVYSNKKTLVNFLLPQNSYLYNPNITYLSFNSEKARQMLLDDGWALKNNAWQKTIDKKTYKLSLSLLVNSDDENRVKISEIIKQNLEEINIKVTINKLNGNAFKTALDSRNYDIALLNATMSASPNLENFLGENNYSNYNNTEINKCISESSDIKDVFYKIQEICKEDYPYIPLCYSKNILAYNEKISGNITPSWVNIFYNFNSWQKKN